MTGEVIRWIDRVPLSVLRLGKRKPRFGSRMFVLVYTYIGVTQNETNFSSSKLKGIVYLLPISLSLVYKGSLIRMSSGLPANGSGFILVL